MTQKKFILLIAAAIILIILVSFGVAKYSKKAVEKDAVKPPPQQLSGPSIEVEGTIQNQTDQNIILQKQDGKTSTFQIIPSTVFYQCSDFANINSCSVKKDKLTKQTAAKVFAKGSTALFVLYKL